MIHVYTKIPHSQGLFQRVAMVVSQHGSLGEHPHGCSLWKLNPAKNFPKWSSPDQCERNQFFPQFKIEDVKSINLY
ncbi:hypothetical protein I3842_13G119300 [Carya illinoinensis]|uniref:Uncharacterized protein n=1 Tax=Carya illinoinensis TaxID=32201 RepID=A0A922AI22_CARIL|nr:hypothetical protein I3842_13G119300 [Carya illinoinensis]